VLSFVAPWALLACARVAEEPEPAAPEAGAPYSDAQVVPPIEANPIQLTLAPFWDIPVGPDGFLDLIPLGGVEVCVEQRRGYEEPWDAFVPVDRAEWPCAVTAEGENAVLRVPALSELLITAKKEGFVDRVLPVTTGPWDQGGNFGVYEMHLYRPESLQALVPSADLELGTIATVVVVDNARFAAGYEPRIEPEAGSLVHTYGGDVVPDAEATLAGEFAGASNPGMFAISMFFNLPSDEYALSWEREGTRCGVNAVLPGFADPRVGVRRVPVLPGSYTMVGASCGCAVPADAPTCSSGDGGT
jgi:hypothetical protein